ncbi:MAG: ABC transporter permease [Myxococcales bacterium FL481]|nr:MAG: ABC transporter permease [Myxococcales bacterium FL481]
MHPEAAATRIPLSPWRRPTMWIAGAVLLLALVTAGLGHWDLIASAHADLAGPSFAAPDRVHPLGTDAVGRDVWLRTLRAAEPSVCTGGLAAMLALAVGTWAGAWAGFAGGTVERITLALAQIVAAVPPLIVIIGLVALLGPGLVSGACGIAAVQWVAVYRVIRAESQRLAAEGFVVASEAMGASVWWRIRHHGAPHLRPLLGTMLAIQLAYAIKAEAVLGFLGLATVDMPSWGRMIASGSTHLPRGLWWLTVAAAAPLTAVVLAAQFLGDALQSSRDGERTAPPRHPR